MLQFIKNAPGHHFPPGCKATGLRSENFRPHDRRPRRTDSSVTIEPAHTAAQLTHVRALMRSFVEWLYTRYQDCPWFIDGYFDRQAFETELASLPGAFAPPAGRLLLASCRGKAAGCVAFRFLDNATCEMKRMYVRPEFHGLGIGKKLAATLIRNARKAGYRHMMLDTGREQFEAHRLYRGLGFSRIDPYYEVPPKQREMLIFMALKL